MTEYKLMKSTLWATPKNTRGLVSVPMRVVMVERKGHPDSKLHPYATGIQYCHKKDVIKCVNVKGFENGYYSSTPKQASKSFFHLIDQQIKVFPALENPFSSIFST